MKRFLPVLALFMMLVYGAFPAAAGLPPCTFESSTLTGTASTTGAVLTFTYDGECGTLEYFEIRVYNVDGDPIDDDSFGDDGVWSLIFDIPAVTGEPITIFIVGLVEESSQGYREWELVVGGGSAGDPGFYCENDGRLTCTLQMAVYVVREDNGCTVDVWRVDEDSVGTPAFVVYADTLADLADSPDEPVLIAQTPDRYIRFYRLPSGEYQVNAGPNAMGDVEVVVWSGCPVRRVYRLDFDVTPTSVP